MRPAGSTDNVSILEHNLFTAAFLHKHGYEHKNLGSHP